MKLSKLTISCLIFILLFLFVSSSYPNLLQESNQEKCFISFFTVGLVVIVIYNVVDSVYR